jgi:hypothetical protein
LYLGASFNADSASKAKAASIILFGRAIPTPPLLPYWRGLLYII